MIANLNSAATDQMLALTDARQAESTRRQTQLELRKADENDRANVARLLTSINEVTFAIHKDKSTASNKQSEQVRSLL